MKDVIIPNSGTKEGKHIKILAEIDLNQPMLRGTMVKMNGIIRWVEFKYERCPDFCFSCGIMGHTERNYKKKELICGESLNLEHGYKLVIQEVLLRSRADLGRIRRNQVR